MEIENPNDLFVLLNLNRSMPKSQNFFTPTETNHHRQETEEEEEEEEECQFRYSDIEMVAIKASSSSYTSLKDLLPPSPPSIMSPTSYNRKDSWREIPLKDPLVQHAAWAYLQPMAIAQESDERSCLAKLRDGLLGCLNDVVEATIKK